MKIRVYTVRVTVMVDPVYTFLTDTNPPDHLWASYHYPVTPPMNRGVVFVCSEDAFDFTQISGLNGVKELPANNIETPWPAVASERRASLANEFNAEHGRMLNSSKFKTWEDGLCQFLREIGHDQRQLRAARTRDFVDAFE